jgi:flagellar motility protein MotE (MotC chaperone)
MRFRPRLMPAALAATGLLLAAKLAALLPAGMEPLAVAPAQASSPAQPPAAPASAVPAPMAEEPSPEQRAERALLEGLRARRIELEGREQALAARELVLAAAERRLTQRLEEMAALQQRLQSADQALGAREEAGWRQMVKLYEGMRPRDAAAIFDDLEMPVLVQLVDRMREAKAAPVLGAMKPDRARLLTAELARHRARPTD